MKPTSEKWNGKGMKGNKSNKSEGENQISESACDGHNPHNAWHNLETWEPNSLTLALSVALCNGGCTGQRFALRVRPPPHHTNTKVKICL